jgi:crotonobetainyl-CoA:carnitine CoA-transferase CaiB-like acyl-CoA transferase
MSIAWKHNHSEEDMPFLTGVRVVELGTSNGVEIAALLLAEAGADVLKVESPDTGTTRKSAAFAIRNRNKRSALIDLAKENASGRLHDLLRDANIFVHDLSPKAALERGLDDTCLKQCFPSLIAVSVLAYPAPHPKSEMRPVDSLALGDAGLLDEQACLNRAGPAYLRLPVGSWGAGYLAAVAAAAKLLAHGRGGAAGAVSTSLVQGLLTSGVMYWYRAEHPTESLRTGNPKSAEPSLFECSDGKWLHILANGDQVPLMRQALDALPAQDRVPIAPATTMARIFPLLPANRKAFRTRPAQEWLNAFWMAGVPVQPALPMGALYEDADLLAQEQVVLVNDPVFGLCRQPGPPFSIGGITLPPPMPAPVLGSTDTNWPLPRRLPPPPPPGAANKPLAGVRILDFGNFVAGPFAMMLAADLGAEVVKVEATTGDPMRWIEWGFNGSQRGKRALALQLKDPRSRPVLERLVHWADIAHHSLRMPAATKLGLSYEALCEINPAIIYCHVSAYGAKGPRKDWPGYDQLFQAMSGWEVENGGEGNRPMWLRFGMMDHHCAMASLYVSLLALRQRDLTGKGRFVSSSLLSAAAFTAETVGYADGGVAPFARLNKEQTGIDATNRLYRCADGWIALLADLANSWEAVMAKLGAGGEAEVARTLSTMPVANALACLQACGADAALAREDNLTRFFDDPDNRASGLIATYQHRDYGKLEQIGSFWSFDGQPAEISRPPPILGQHSEEILAELGFSGGQISAFIDQGVVARVATQTAP